MFSTTDGSVLQTHISELQVVGAARLSDAPEILDERVDPLGKDLRRRRRELLHIAAQGAGVQ